ncbi:MAG TPA: glycogen/starch synthase [bacterium]|nr:glycogen/starch synthase [bacterium]HPT29439.1 glycogen/starch synthase [bacterium]
MAQKLRIVHIASEVAPYSKTGGLGDVSRSLPKAIKRLGHEVIAITPFYGQIIDPKKNHLKLILSNVKIYLNSEEEIEVNYWQGYLMDDLPIYFIENKKYFSRKKNLYGSSHENVRFLIFDVAALKLLSLLKFKADIIHCHDWQTGLIPYYLKTDFRYSKTLKKAKTIYTIHNLAFQLGHNWWEIPVEDRDYGKKKIPHISNPVIETINFAKRAILSADIINTVSEQYRNEIMTKHFGQDLHRILKNREERLFGIINGIEHHAYNPEIDKSLAKNYNYKKPQGKAENKKALQRKAGLALEPRTPLFCATSRLTFQKGFDLILSLMKQLLKDDVQFVFMGDGEKQYIKEIKHLNKLHPKKVVWLPFNEKIENLMYAGSDFFLLPSVYEPCGINQLKAMRYGCIPVVREVGGLYDTVSNYNPGTSQGTGFTFKGNDQYSLYGAMVRALENYKDQKSWNALVAKVMQISSSWEIPAKKYIKLYRKALKD